MLPVGWREQLDQTIGKARAPCLTQRHDPVVHRAGGICASVAPCASALIPKPIINPPCVVARARGWSGRTGWLAAAD